MCSMLNQSIHAGVTSVMSNVNAQDKMSSRDDVRHTEEERKEKN